MIRLRALLDMPRKKRFLKSRGFYPTLSRSWCDDHLRTVSREDFRSQTLKELEKTYPRQKA